MLIRVRGNRVLLIIRIREGEKQVEPMYMLLYEASVDFLEEQLKRDLPGPMQVCYADDLYATAINRAASPLMQRLGELGLSEVVFPKAEKYQYLCTEEVPEPDVHLATD